MAKKKKKKEKPFNPEVDTGQGKPVRARVAVGDVNDKYSTYPSNGLTPRRLARIFRAADDGDVSEQMELFEEMEENYKKSEKDLFELKHELVDTQMKVEELLDKLDRERQERSKKTDSEQVLEEKYKKLSDKYQLLLSYAKV